MRTDELEETPDAHRQRHEALHQALDEG